MRTGFTLLELTVASGLLGMAFLVTIPMLTRVRDLREETQRRFMAQLEASNIVEQLSLSAAQGTLDEAIAQPAAISPEGRVVLSDVNVAITSAETTDDFGHRRVTVSVSWRNDVGDRPAPASIEVWFPDPKESP